MKDCVHVYILPEPSKQLGSEYKAKCSKCVNNSYTETITVLTISGKDEAKDLIES